MVDALSEIGLQPLALPDSGLYVCAGWPGAGSDDDPHAATEHARQARTLAQAALAEGIALAPGDYFLLEPRATSWFRFNVAHADDPRLRAFLQRAARQLPHP